MSQDPTISGFIWFCYLFVAKYICGVPKIVFLYELQHPSSNLLSFYCVSMRFSFVVFCTPSTFIIIYSLFFPGVPSDPLASVILVSLLPLLVTLIVVVGMFYWYRSHRKRMHSQEWESNIKKRKPKTGGLDCSDACAIMMDDDRSDSSSTHANSLNHNTEPLPIELDLLVCISKVFNLCFKLH